MQPSALPVHAVASSNADRQWQPSEAQRERVLNDARRYLQAKDEGRFADAHALFSPAQKAAVSLAGWEEDQRRFYAQAGTLGERRLIKVTWYLNTPNAPPGLYAAVDFVGSFSNLDLYCGFVALQQQVDGSFAVSREEENSIPKGLMARLSSEQLRSLRAQYRC
jgi:Protein of unknown function (DUF4019)